MRPPRRDVGGEGKRPEDPALGQRVRWGRIRGSRRGGREAR